MLVFAQYIFPDPLFNDVNAALSPKLHNCRFQSPEPPISNYKKGDQGMTIRKLALHDQVKLQYISSRDPVKKFFYMCKMKRLTIN